MKVSGFLAVAIFSLFGFVLAFSEIDQEIFRLRREIEQTEGPGVTFYDFVGAKPGASLDDINKAVRKTSIRLHPDKFKPSSTLGGRLTPGQAENQKKKALARYQRLKVVIEILRGPARDRYDHFLKNGFPMWKGTGYYYDRYRPGLGSVLVALFIFVGGLGHYGLLALKASQNRRFMQSYIDEARTAAWGSAGIPGLDNKRSVSGRRKVQAENGKVFMVESNGDVLLVQQDEFGNDVEYPLDLSEIEGPKWSNTALVTLPKWIIGRFSKKTDQAVDDEDSEDSSDAAPSKKAKKALVGKKVEKEGALPRRRVKAGRKPLKPTKADE